MVMVTDKKFDTAMLVGARPNFVKVAPLLNKFEENNLNVLFIHTGQHWEKNMSEDIFRDLGLREPDVNLNIQNKSMNQQLGSMIIELDNYLDDKSVDSLFVFGDVTSTLAGAITAKNNSIHVGHWCSSLYEHTVVQEAESIANVQKFNMWRTTFKTSQPGTQGRCETLALHALLVHP